MNKGMISLLAMAVSLTAHAAKQEPLWGAVDQVLPQLKQDELPFGKHGLSTMLQNTQQKDYQLQLIGNAKANSQHVRYQLVYKNIPIWGQQLIFHAHPGATPTVTGINITDIETDITSIKGTLSAADVEQKIMAGVHESVKFKTINKVIYIDEKDKAHLAYHLSFYTNGKKEPITAPNYLVDANTGKILKEWNNIHSKRIGQGMGGNAFPLPYRPGTFQHGNAIPGLPSLGKFDVQSEDGVCHVQNNAIRVLNLENAPLGYDSFPITIFDEANFNLKAFSYPCSPFSQYLNYSDGTSGPVNYAFSPVNDTMYFAQKTIDMYVHVYGIDNPLGTDLPVRAFTHLGEMDNAFAIPTIYFQGILVAHQQIVIGNGSSFLTAPAQSVIAHELSHNFTEQNSGLIYQGQSGGLNEAFSDMAAIALEDYISKEYPWYWDGEDWTIGREAVIGGQPLRYMDDPTQDGRSIGDASDYNDWIDVHHSSGVFNKAFYLLAHKPGWSVEQAFQVMIHANQNYWSPIAYFDFAACGVIQAAVDFDIDKTAVIESFAEVGVFCPMHRF